MSRASATWWTVAQVHAELPITLILGMATSAGALQQMLPVAAASMLEPQHFQLASSMERCNTTITLNHSIQKMYTNNKGGLVGIIPSYYKKSL